jgi:hypothetical protein
MAKLDDIINSISQVLENKRNRREFLAQHKEDVYFIKMKLLYRFSNKLVKELYSFYAIPQPLPYSFDWEHETKVKIMLTRTHYLKNAADNLAFDQIYTFAQQYGIKCHDLKMEQKHLLEIYLMNIGEKPAPTSKPVKFPPTFNNLIKQIENFEPRYRYPRERYYHTELYAKLQVDYPHGISEKGTSDIRPDIVIGKVAIELKGPTYHYDLQSIYSKCFEYLTEYEALVIVLFDLHATEGQFKKVLNNVNRYFPRAVIIRKEVKNLPEFQETFEKGNQFIKVPEPKQPQKGNRFIKKPRKR